MNFDDFKYNVDKAPGGVRPGNVFYENLKNTFYEELKNTEKHNDYFKGFNPDSVENFKLQYAKEKAHLTELYAIYIKDSFQNKELKYREHTEKIFEVILQKKLWDIQLKWRAAQINIKEIRTTWDFRFWGDHISSCPFLPMVTESEIEVMKQFLNDNNYDDLTDGWFWGWQDYDNLMQKDKDGDLSDLPDWYEFYDGRLGTGILLQLPNTRGIKEEYYMDLGRDYFVEMQKENKPTESSAIPPVYIPAPPYLSSSLEEMFKYATNFEEDQHFVELFRIRYETNKPNESDSPIDDFSVEVAIEQLKESEIPVYMPGGLDWREAIIKCSQQYLNSIVAKEIDVVYEEYKMFLEIGLSKNDDGDVLKKFESYDFSALIIPMILKGRELCGEPQDFDY